MSKNSDLASINQKLLAMESEYLAIESLRVFCGTYNVNGRLPDESLRAWLCVSSSSPPHIYAIGFQEVVDLTTTSFILQSDWMDREQRWTDYVSNELCFSHNKTLNEHNSYKLVSKIRMYGIFLLVYAKESIAKDVVSEVLMSYVPTGIMDTVGNKGSVAVSLKLHETRVCFVCSHFASDTDRLEKRNSDYRSTKQRLKFEYNANLDFYDLDEHDMVFWMGLILSFD
jgi:hypothetical protein